MDGRIDMKTPVTKADLEKYSKQELIEIINEFDFIVDPFQRNGYLYRVIVEARHKRQERLIQKAYQHSQRAYDLRTESYRLMEHYVGKKYSEVPQDVLNKVSSCVKQAQKEDEAYERLQKEIARYGKNAR